MLQDMKICRRDKRREIAKVRRIAVESLATHACHPKVGCNCKALIKGCGQGS